MPLPAEFTEFKSAERGIFSLCQGLYAAPTPAARAAEHTAAQVAEPAERGCSASNRVKPRP